MLWHQIGNFQGNYTFDARFYKETTYRPHFHRNYELLYAVAGACDVQVASKQLTVSNAQFLLIPPYAIHGFTMDSSCKLWACVYMVCHQCAQAQILGKLDFDRILRITQLVSDNLDKKHHHGRSGPAIRWSTASRPCAALTGRSGN